MAIIYRTAGPWGAGAGADLPAATVDGNFYDLATRVDTLESDPPEAISIESIDVTGNLMTINMSNGSTQGPFALPVVSIRFTGPYLEGSSYLVNDVFTTDGEFWIVRVAHVAPDPFDRNLFTVDGFAYTKILERMSESYDVQVWLPGLIPYESGIVFQHIACRDFTLNADFTDSQAFLRVATAMVNLSFPILRNGLVIGYIEFAAGENLEVDGDGQFGTFLPVTSPGEPIIFVQTDRLAIEAPIVLDSDATDLSVTFAGLVAGSTP